MRALLDATRARVALSVIFFIEQCSERQHFRLVLSNTCSDCVGIPQGGPGASIVLDVLTIPEPASVALWASVRSR